jgi:methylenetetrahydrofolate dehydrogenase (NADP+) / methenyltetrahydrofolate cyclohydrolase
MEHLSVGRDLARTIIERVVVQSHIVRRHLGRPASVAIVAASDEVSRRFVQIKRDMLIELDLTLHAIWLNNDTSISEALNEIAELNVRDDIDAIFLQFPLPPQLSATVLSDAIVQEKDIDCSSKRCADAFRSGSGKFVPVAAVAVLDLLRQQLGALRDRRIAVYEVDDAFGLVLQELLRREGAAVAPTESALDALVITERVPQPEVFSKVERVSVILDAGYYLEKRGSDWVPEAVRRTVNVYLTQYGNVGPLTVAHLARATIEAARAFVKKF